MKTWRQLFGCFGLTVILLLFQTNVTEADEGHWVITQLPYQYAEHPVINNSGEIVWAGAGGGIFSSVRGELSASGVNPHLANSGEVVYADWFGGPYWDLVSTTRGQLTTGGIININASDFDVNSNGEVVYAIDDTNGYLQVNSTARGQITFDATDHWNPCINDNGEIAWNQYVDDDTVAISSTRGILGSCPNLLDLNNFGDYCFSGNIENPPGYYSFPHIFSSAHGVIINDSTQYEWGGSLNDAGTIVWLGQGGIGEGNWVSNTPSAVTLGASGTNGNALLNSTVNPNGAPTMAWFEWGANAGCSNATQITDIGSRTANSPLSAALTGLIAGVAYYYQVVASNSYGLAKGQKDIFQSPRIALDGANPMTNECHNPFVDPGANAVAAPKAIAAGLDYSMALKFDGTVAAWGGTGNGETSIPADLSNVVAIAAGWYHGLALKDDGTVVGWGRGYEGETTPPIDLSNVVAIAAGDFFSVALKGDGTVVAFGWYVNVPPGLSNVIAIAGGLALKNDGTVVALDGTSIPLGLSNVVAIASGLALKNDGTVVALDGSSVPPGLSNVVAIASGLDNDLALKNDGTVIGFGDDFYGQASGLATLTNVIAIAAGGYHSLAVTSDGNLVAVGYDLYGQTDVPGNLGGDIIESGAVDYDDPGIYTLTYAATNSLGGVGTATRTVVVADTTPPSLTLLGANPLVMPVNTTFVDPGATAIDMCAGDLTSNIIVTGNVKTTILGTNTLTYTVTDPSGNMASTNRTVITVVGSPFVTTLTANGIHHSATLSGTVNPNGGSTKAWFEWGTSILHGNVTIPISVGNGLTNVTLSSPLAGLTPGVTYHYRIVATNSAGRSNGRDAVFQNPPAIVQASAIMLRGANPLTNVCDSPFIDPGAVVIAPLAAIAAGDSYSLALKTDGTVVGWGDNSWGETSIPPGLSNVTAISAGYIHCLALKTNGTVVGWGDDSFSETNTPAGLSNVVAIATGWGYSLALKADGTLADWGENNFTPAPIPSGLSHVVAISVGFDLSLAVKEDGTVIGWGQPPFGGLNVPTGLSNVVAVAAGESYGLALKSDGTVVGWGYNGEGQASVPSGLSNVVAIAAGFYHSLALKRDGTVVGWGDDFYGESTPPPNLKNVIAIAAGAYHSLALKSDGTVVGWGMDFYGESDITTSGTNLVTNIPASGVVNVNCPGTYTLTYTATNSIGRVSRVTRTVIVVDTTPPMVAITVPTSGQQWSNPVFTVTGTATDNVAVARVFLSLNSGIWKNAVGTTRWSAVMTLVPGTNTVSAYAVDTSGNRSMTNEVSFVYVLARPLVITTTLLPNGTNGVAYSQSLAATGGMPPYSWTRMAGSLPPGLSLSTNGVISGTPMASGTSVFTVRVTDAASAFRTKLLTLVINTSKMPIRPVLNSAGHFSGNQFRMQFNGVAGQNYTLQMSTNLTSTNWMSILVTNAPGGSFFITDTNATNSGRFYRIWVGP
jgi:alpha-tubulin suppressor-like RCC1 family protein